MFTLTSNDEKHGNVRLNRAFIKVDWANDDHADWNDNADTVEDCATNCSDEKEEELDQKVDKVPRGLVSITDTSKQRVVRGGLSWRQTAKLVTSIKFWHISNRLDQQRLHMMEEDLWRHLEELALFQGCPGTMVAETFDLCLDSPFQLVKTSHLFDHLLDCQMSRSSNKDLLILGSFNTKKELTVTSMGLTMILTLLEVALSAGLIEEGLVLGGISDHFPCSSLELSAEKSRSLKAIKSWIWPLPWAFTCWRLTTAHGWTGRGTSSWRQGRGLGGRGRPIRVGGFHLRCHRFHLVSPEQLEAQVVTESKAKSLKACLTLLMNHQLWMPWQNWPCPTLTWSVAAATQAQERESQERREFQTVQLNTERSNLHTEVEVTWNDERYTVFVQVDSWKVTSFRFSIARIDEIFNIES